MTPVEIEEIYQELNKRRRCAADHVGFALKDLAGAAHLAMGLDRFDLALDMVTLCIRLQNVNTSVPGGQFVPRASVTLDDKGKTRV